MSKKRWKKQIESSRKGHTDRFAEEATRRQGIVRIHVRSEHRGGPQTTGHLEVQVADRRGAKNAGHTKKPWPS